MVSADSAALYAGIPVLTAAPAYPARLVGVVPLDEEVSVGEYQRLAHEAIDEIVAAGGRRSSSAAPASICGRRSPTSGCRRPRRRAPGSGGRRLYDQLGPEAAHALLAEPRRRRGGPCPPERPAARGACARAGRGRLLARASGRPPLGRRRAAADAARRYRPLAATSAIEARVEAMIARGVVDEARRAWPAPLSEAARKVLGLEEFATLPRQAAAEVASRRRGGSPRYQRKWLRRLPVDGYPGGRPGRRGDRR